jgi:hypothetical protein
VPRNSHVQVKGRIGKLHECTDSAALT